MEIQLDKKCVNKDSRLWGQMTLSEMGIIFGNDI